MAGFGIRESLNFLYSKNYRIYLFLDESDFFDGKNKNCNKLNVSITNFVEWKRHFLLID